MIYDIAIIGGGINGCGIARDAATRGLSVYLCDQGDLAAATSSASTKLIHGGLRYLENFDFRLVRESLSERETLLRIAPHLVRPKRFLLPLARGMRSGFVVQAGLWLYDHLAGAMTLPRSRRIDLKTDPAGLALKPDHASAFEYSDCCVDDARLVIANAMDAARHGATVEPRTAGVEARRHDGVWQITVQATRSDTKRLVVARALVNATGPWVNQFLTGATAIRPVITVRLDKGSHIVVPRHFAGDRAWLFQNPDRRVVFAIPYESDFTLIGTTEQDYSGDPAVAAMTDEERVYLLQSVNRWFRNPVTGPVLWSYSGVRTLCEPAKQAGAAARSLSREYSLVLDAPAGGAPLLNVYGGKLTTYRSLAEKALAQLTPYLRIGECRTAREPLPGGDIPNRDLAAFSRDCAARYGFLADADVMRLAAAYGSRVDAVLSHARTAADAGQCFGHGLTEAELDYLVNQEWARTAEDVLWRRTKLGLRFTRVEAAAIAAWLSRAALPGTTSAAV